MTPATDAMETGNDSTVLRSPHDPEAARCSTWYESAQRGRPDADTLTVVGPVADARTEVGAAGVV